MASTGCELESVTDAIALSFREAAVGAEFKSSTCLFSLEDSEDIPSSFRFAGKLPPWLLVIGD
jgi:hypothetical protein